MKKLFLGLLFAGMSFLVSASSGEPVNKVSLKKDRLEQSDKAKTLPVVYEVTYTCGSTTVTVCCFDYYIGAYLFLQDNPASAVCASIPQP